MYITSINLSPATCSALGLGFSNGIKIEDIRETVGLFGKNGMGKTRLLKIIYNLLTGIGGEFLLAKCILSDEINIDFSDDTIKHQEESLKENKDALTYVCYKYNCEKDGLQGTETKKLQTKYNNISNKSEIKCNIDAINQYVKQHVIFIKHSDLLKLTDTLNIRPSDNFLDKDNYQDRNIEDFQKKILPYFDSVVNNNVIFKKIQQLFKDLTGKQIEKVSNSDQVKNGRDRTFSCFSKIKIANDLCQFKELSDGEKILFSLTLLLWYYKKDNKCPFNKCVLIFDEPERNLHAAAVKELLTALKEDFNPSQIFLASHSIDILASLEYHERFHLKEDDTLCLRHDVEEIIHNLTDNLYHKVKSLYISLSDFSYCNFIQQCFSNPKSIDSINSKDEQVIAFVDRIETKIEDAQTQQQKLKILEIGAGTGRVYKSAKENLQHCDFHAYEPNPYCRKKCKELGLRVHDKIEDIEENFDILLFCNVLHEIEPDEWICTLNQLITKLKDDGEFIFIERNVLTTGEHAHEYDFFVLGVEELSKLFSIGISELSDIKKNSECKPKISCIPIEKRLLNDVTKNSQTEAINQLKVNSWEKIKVIKEALKSNPNMTEKEKMKFGYELAFYYTQYINCKYFLENNEKE